MECLGLICFTIGLVALVLYFFVPSCKQKRVLLGVLILTFAAGSLLFYMNVIYKWISWYKCVTLISLLSYDAKVRDMHRAWLRYDRNDIILSLQNLESMNFHIFASQGSDPLPRGKRIGTLDSEDGIFTVISLGYNAIFETIICLASFNYDGIIYPKWHNNTMKIIMGNRDNYTQMYGQPF